jgi:hypothetical protein
MKPIFMEVVDEKSGIFFRMKFMGMEFHGYGVNIWVSPHCYEHHGGGGG